MILTPHAIIGASLANIIPDNPALGFGLAFLGHYVLDMLPHTDYEVDNFVDKETKTVRSIFKNSRALLDFLFIIFDFIIAVFLCILLFVRDEKTAIITLVGIMGGVLSDFFQFLYLKFKNQPWIFFQKIHKKFHFDIDKKPNLLVGVLMQILSPVLFLIIYYLIKK